MKNCEDCGKEIENKHICSLKDKTALWKQKNVDVKDILPSIYNDEHAICTAGMIKNVVDKLPDFKNTRFVGIAIVQNNCIDKKLVIEMLNEIHFANEKLNWHDLDALIQRKIDEIKK